MVVPVPSWTDGVVDWVPRSELNDGEGGQLKFLCLPGGALGRSFRNNGGCVFAQPKTDPGLVVVWARQRVVGGLDKFGSVLLRSGASRFWLVFPPPERIPPNELLVGLSLLHFVVKGVQSIERDGRVLGKLRALGLVKSVGYGQHVALDNGTHLFVRLSQEPHVLECVCGHFFIENAVRITNG